MQHDRFPPSPGDLGRDSATIGGSWRNVGSFAAKVLGRPDGGNRLLYIRTILALLLAVFFLPTPLGAAQPVTPPGLPRVVGNHFPGTTGTIRLSPSGSSKIDRARIDFQSTVFARSLIDASVLLVCGVAQDPTENQDPSSALDASENAETSGEANSSVPSDRSTEPVDRPNGNEVSGAAESPNQSQADNEPGADSLTANSLTKDQSTAAPLAAGEVDQESEFQDSSGEQQNEREQADNPPLDSPNGSPDPKPDASSSVGSGDGQSLAPTGPTMTATALVPPVLKAPAWLNLRTNILLGVVLATLAIASIVGRYLQRQPTESVNPAMVRRFRQRLNAWWLMCAILVFGLLLQPMGTVVLFGLVSFWALREFITMAPTRRGDHRALFWALIVFTPLQYVLIAAERSGFQWRAGRNDFYGLYSIVIPVYASLFVPARIAMSGDHKRFLERSAQITVGLLICVYALSYAPALINLNLTTSSGVKWTGSPAGLLFFFILVSQLSDILQWSWGQLLGKRIIAPEVSTGRTWEGFAGGTLSTGLIGAGLFWVTPFTFWEAACMSMIVALMGMFGGMTMSAIKRDRGVNDYGSLVLGHAGVLDRIDTLCFAAPVFYHLTRFFFSS